MIQYSSCCDIDKHLTAQAAGSSGGVCKLFSSAGRSARIEESVIGCVLEEENVRLRFVDFIMFPAKTLKWKDSVSIFVGVAVASPQFLLATPSCTTRPYLGDAH